MLRGVQMNKDLFKFIPKTETELEELQNEEDNLTSPHLLDDIELINNYDLLKNNLSILDRVKDSYIAEINTRTKGKNVKLGRYYIEYKKKKLFDINKALDLINDKGNAKDFETVKLDNDKIKKYIKSEHNYDDFVKYTSPSLTYSVIIKYKCLACGYIKEHNGIQKKNSFKCENCKYLSPHMIVE